MLTVTVRPPPDSNEYNSFDRMVKEKAITKFNFSYGDEPVNPIVTAFYDAVILYAIALNETLEAGGSITNGTEITQRMRGKTFQGTYVIYYCGRVKCYLNHILSLSPKHALLTNPKKVALRFTVRIKFVSFIHPLIPPLLSPSSLLICPCRFTNKTLGAFV